VTFLVFVFFVVIFSHENKTHRIYKVIPSNGDPIGLRDDDIIQSINSLHLILLFVMVNDDINRDLIRRVDLRSISNLNSFAQKMGLQQNPIGGCVVRL